jgi:glutamate---cysteine ligase / carboxylate-amine ligase
VQAVGGQRIEGCLRAGEIGLDDERHTARGEPRRHLATQAIEERAAIRSGIPGPRGALPGQLVALAGYVGGVGEYEIEASICDRREKVAAHSGHPHPVEGGVQAHVQDRASRDVDRRDVSSARESGGDRERAAAREHVQHRRPTRQITVAHDLDQEPAVAGWAQDPGQDDGADGRRGGGHVTGDTRFDARHVAAIFDAPEPLTVGLEEEVMLLDPRSLDLAPIAPTVLARVEDDPRFKGELPASQIEIVTEPATTVAEAVAALASARADLARACEGLALPAVAGVHPFASAEGELTGSDRYAGIRSEYGSIARRQLVASLQVHVAIGDSARTLDVYNGLREYLPDVAALAANAAFHEGRDTGLASVRPKLAELLPRQGMPPPISSWDEFAAELAWGRAAGTVPEPRLWWWELRPNPTFGTLEVRVPDAQSTIADATGVAAFVHGLAGWLSRRDAPSRIAPTWRIEENRWSAARYGIEGEMADLESGKTRPTRERLRTLLDELEATSNDRGSLRESRRLVAGNGAIRQRELAADLGVEGMTAWLAEHFVGSG